MLQDFCTWAKNLNSPLSSIVSGKVIATVDTLVVEDGVLDHLERIKIYAIKIESEDDQVQEIPRIANLSMKLGYQLEAENRPLTKDEAYIQLGHSASLLKAILDYVQ